jgi:hypothetical protein
MTRPRFLPDVPVENLLWALGLPVLAVNALALSGTVIAVLGGPPLVQWILSAVTLALVALFAVREDKETDGTGRLAGTYVLARIAVVATALIIAADHVHRAGALTGILIMAVALMAEPAVRSMAAQAFPYASGFPGVRVRTTVRVSPRIVFVANVVGSWAVIASAPTSWMVPVTLTAGCACALITAACVVDMGIFVVQRLLFNSRLPGLWKRMNPTFALHWQAPRGSLHQIAMWMDQLQELGTAFFVVTRTKENFTEVTDRWPTLPVVLRVGLENVGEVISPSLKTVFYVNTSTRNDHMLRYAHLTHIQLNHGDSDKIASYSPVFRAYDTDFVAGQAAIDRFDAAGLATAPGFFAIVGRPQVAGVAIAQGPIAAVNNPTVLYAPTWVGNTDDSNYSSLPEGPRIVRALLDRGATVVFRPHPYWDRNHHTAAGRDAVVEMLRKDAAASGRHHVFGEEAESTLSVFECFNLSDAMISDVSSVVNDYLSSEKPYAMMAVTETVDHFTAEFPVARGAYVIDFASLAASSDPLDESLDAMLGPDPLRPVRQELKAYYLGDIPADHYAERFREEASRYV